MGGQSRKIFPWNWTSIKGEVVVLFRSLRVPTYHERWRALVMMLDGVSDRVMVNIMVYHAFFSEVVGGLVAVWYVAVGWWW